MAQARTSESESPSAESNVSRGSCARAASSSERRSVNWFYCRERGVRGVNFGNDSVRSANSAVNSIQREEARGGRLRLCSPIYRRLRSASPEYHHGLGICVSNQVPGT